MVTSVRTSENVHYVVVKPGITPLIKVSNLENSNQGIIMRGVVGGGGGCFYTPGVCFGEHEQKLVSDVKFLTRNKTA